MINLNGEIIPEDNPIFTEQNRAFRYGDGLFETIRTLGNSINFWEDHYLRLMASMRILRMEIPMNFTMEFLSDEIIKLLSAKGLEQKPGRIRLEVFRNDGGKYKPTTNEVSFVISAEELQEPFYTVHKGPYKVDLFKEYYLNTGLLSSLKTNNRILNVIGSIYAEESQLDSHILLNHNKQVVEGLSGNIFLINGKQLSTPPITDGCINGIIRKKVIEICKSNADWELEERSISPFELLRADEMFFTNAIAGIRSVTHYRRKEYIQKGASEFVGKLNALARLA